MEDKSLEKMMIRSARETKNFSLLLLCTFSICFFSIIFIILRKIFFLCIGGLNLPIYMAIITIASCPVALIIPVIARHYAQIRLGGQDGCVRDIFREQLRSILVLSVYAIGVSVVQIGLLLGTVIWCGLQIVPHLGSFLFFLFSYVPSMMSIAMSGLFFVHIFTLNALGVYLASNPLARIDSILPFLRNIWTNKWLSRIKIMAYGFLPLLFLYLFSSTYQMHGIHVSIEIMALCIRVVVMSCLASFCALFAIHMAVEADRFVESS